MSKTYLFALLALSAARLAPAAGPATTARDLRRDPAPVAANTQQQATGVVSPTPEMWFYEQERTRYEDPKAAVRRRAEQRADERSARLASLKWFGMSNSRPMASPVPYFGTYSPVWTAPGYDANRWQMGTASTVYVKPGTGLY